MNKLLKYLCYQHQTWYEASGDRDTHFYYKWARSDKKHGCRHAKCPWKGRGLANNGCKMLSVFPIVTKLGKYHQKGTKNTPKKRFWDWHIGGATAKPFSPLKMNYGIFKNHKISNSNYRFILSARNSIQTGKYSAIPWLYTYDSTFQPHSNFPKIFSVFWNLVIMEVNEKILQTHSSSPTHHELIHSHRNSIPTLKCWHCHRLSVTDSYFPYLF